MTPALKELVTLAHNPADERGRIGVWAPGRYTNICGSCSLQFEGDKRAIRCERCARSGVFKNTALGLAEHVENIARPRPLSEWSEEVGDVLWWKFPITEAPYLGTPLDLGRTVEIRVQIATFLDPDPKPSIRRKNIGGWPGYHTHWTPLPPIPEAPK